MMERVGIVRNSEMLIKQKNWLDQFKVNEMTELDGYTSQDIERDFYGTCCRVNDRICH